MISNLTKPGQQGLVQGVSRLYASFGRALGPFVCGIFFSICANHHIPIVAFAIVAFGYVAVWLIMLTVKASSVQKSV